MMMPQMTSSTTATIAITLIVLVGMYILYKDLKKLEVSIEKLQTRAACAKVLSKPSLNEIVEDTLDEDDASKDGHDDMEEVVQGVLPSDLQDAANDGVATVADVDVVGAAIQKLKQEVLEEEAAASKAAV